MKLLRLASIFTLFTCFAGSLRAAQPTWWVSGTTQIIETSGTANNYAPANLGQLKHVAKQAKTHLDVHLPGGAGSAISTLVDSFEPRAGQGYTQEQIDAFRAENYAPINLGQLKAVAKPFYDRLLAVGYDTKANLIAHGYPVNWAYDYPWDPQTPVTENYAPANIGQLKMVFSFDATGFDSDDDEMADSWEISHFGNLDSIATGDADGDGLTNLQEYLAGSDPQEYYNGTLPLLQKQSGDNQSGVGGEALANPLVVKVMTSGSVPLANAPVAFNISGSYGQIATTGTGIFGSTLNVVTGTAGTAAVYLKPSGTAGTVNQVQALVTTGTSSAAVTFSATTQEGGLKINPSELVLEVLRDEEAQSQLTLSNGSSETVAYGVRFHGESELGIVLPHEGDTYGYRWATSDDVGGPEYVWQDISTTGSLLESVSDADDDYESVTLPFAFSFYGETFTEVFVGSNGYLTFGAGSSEYSNSALPSNASPSRLLAALFKDLNPGSQGEIYYQADQNKAVFQFENVKAYSGGGFYTFQIVLDKDGGIRYYYKDIEGAVDNVTVGVQNVARDDGFSLQYGSTLLKDQFAVLISDRNLPWVGVDPASGSIASQDVVALLLKAAPPDIPTGDYVGQVEFYDVAEAVPSAWLDATVRVKVASSPTDADGDGLPDAWETQHMGGLSQAGKDDPDEDGLNNGDEFTAGTNPNSGDTDGDGLSDSDEIAKATNPLAGDSDGDGISDGDEVNMYGSNPNSADSDGDGMHDGFEITHDLDPLSDDAFDDVDGDRVPNLWEFAHLTDPGDKTSRPNANQIVAEDGSGTSTTVQGALDAVSQDYEIIEIKAGQYLETLSNWNHPRKILILGENRAGEERVELVGNNSGGATLELFNTAVVDGVVITQAQAENRNGRGLYVGADFSSNFHVRIQNTLITGNSSNSGSAIYCNGPRVALVHTTVVRNDSGGGEIVYNSNGNVEVVNSILWNDSQSALELRPYTDVSITDSIVRGGQYGGINEEPQLTPAGMLTATSPARNAGDVHGVLEDIDGEQRPSGARVDLGWDEFVDTDSDGLPDSDDIDEDPLPADWIEEYFGTAGATPSGDPNGNGWSNLTEYLAGTNPAVAHGESGPAFAETELRVFTPLE